MTEHVEIKIDNDTLSVCGDLDFSNVMMVYQDSLQFFSIPHANIIIDFSGLRSTNSAVLAIIVDWMRAARAKNTAIQFKNLSADVMSLARASGMNQVLESVMI